MDNIYRAYFEVTGLTDSRRDKELKATLIDNFVKLRHEVIQDLNPRYDSWNEEFEVEFGKLNLWDPDNENIYTKYMCKKQDEILKKYDGIYKGLVIRSNPEERGDLIGLYNFRSTQVKIELYLIPC